MNRIQFAHANGFPAKSYSYFFQQLSFSEIEFVNRMGHGDYRVDDDFSQLANELLDNVDAGGKGSVLGLGHSTGATLILLAAIRRPDVFKHIVVIEPTIFGLRKRMSFFLLKLLGLLDYSGPAKSAIKRRKYFGSRIEAEQHFSSKPFFSGFHSQCLKDYVEHGLTDNADGVELTFSAEIEAQIFRTLLMQIPDALKHMTGTLLVGSNSKMFDSSDVRWWQKNAPGFHIVMVDAGHMLPMEKPYQTANIVNEVIRKKMN